MRIFKPTKSKYWIELRDHLGKVRRFAGLTDKKQTELLGQQIQRLINSKVAGEQPDAHLTKWLEGVPPRLRKHFVRIGVLDIKRATASKLLTEHLAEFRATLAGNTERYIRQIHNALTQTFADCQFNYWSDIDAVRLETYLKEKFLPDSQRTFNAYLKAVKQFCNWMVKNRRASESPIMHLSTIQVTDPKKKRRAIEVSELTKLFEAAEAGPVCLGMSGHERAMLYRLAVETGLRANELRSLKVSSFDLAGCTITVEAAYSKHRRQDVQGISIETAAKLRTFLAGKLPNVQVFKIPEKTAVMLRADLKVVGIPYKDEAGRDFDFHALRHQCGTLLAAAGVTPKEAQDILRHSDINLTMRVYTHTLKGSKAAAVSKLAKFMDGKKESKILA